MTAQGKIDLDAIVRDVCEWADRTSPDECPDKLLITPDELRGVLEEAVALARQAQQPAGGLDRVIAAIRTAGRAWSITEMHDGQHRAWVGAGDDWHEVGWMGGPPEDALTAAAQAAGIEVPS